MLIVTFELPPERSNLSFCSQYLVGLEAYLHKDLVGLEADLRKDFFEKTPNTLRVLRCGFSILTSECPSRHQFLPNLPIFLTVPQGNTILGGIPWRLTLELSDTAFRKKKSKMRNLLNPPNLVLLPISFSYQRFKVFPLYKLLWSTRQLR